MPLDDAVNREMERLAREEARVRREVSRYAPMLVPGVIDDLSYMWKSLGSLPGPDLVERISRNMALPAIRGRYFSTEYVEPELPGGGKPDVLRQVLMRHAADLAPGAVDGLHRELSPKVTAWNQDPHRIAKMVAEFLESPAVAARYAAEPPRRSEGEARLATIIGRHFPELKLGSDDALAAQLSKEIHFGWRSKAEHEVVREVARILKNPVVAAEHVRDGAPLPADDPRLVQHRVDPAPTDRTARPANLFRI